MHQACCATSAVGGNHVGTSHKFRKIVFTSLRSPSSTPPPKITLRRGDTARGSRFLPRCEQYVSIYGRNVDCDTFRRTSSALNVGNFAAASASRSSSVRQVRLSFALVIFTTGDKSVRCQYRNRANRRSNNTCRKSKFRGRGTAEFGKVTG